MAKPVHIETSALQTKLFIDGKFVDAVDGQTFKTVNPATEEVITSVAEASAADVDLAVAAAKEAFYNGEWSKASGYQRSRWMNKLADLIERDLAYIATLESMDNGKPVGETFNVDLPFVIKVFRYYAGWCDKLGGDTVSNCDANDTFTYTLSEPVGVVGQIIPWNFPLLMVSWKLGPALATGCSVVLKLAEQTPLTGLYFAKLIAEAGYPAGAVNILSGWGDVTTHGKEGPGSAICKHPDVDKVAFTGSTAVGRIIMRECANTFKRVSLELGGKSPNIIFPDADLDEAVKGVKTAIFFNAGEVCCAGSRLLVHEDIYDEFMKRTVEYCSNHVVGNPMDPATQQGPQVSKEQFEQVLGYIESGKQEGAKCLLGGSRAHETGYFVKPTIFGDVSGDMKIWNEEIFGPVVAVRKFKTIDEVCGIANNTVYGLAAAVWSRDAGTIKAMVKKLRAGTVWVNCFNSFDAAMPFGGYKASGIGRELGKYALANYTEVKAVWDKRTAPIHA